MLGRDGEVLAQKGRLIKTSADASLYKCESVNRAFIRKTGHDNFKVLFKAKTENGSEFVHHIYWLKWNKVTQTPIWVRHIPSVSFSDPSVIDTQVRSRWRYSKFIYGYNINPQRAYEYAFREHSLSKGHLAPVGDFTLAAERHATFQLSNTVPQPQTHNNGPWKKIEDFVRRIFNTRTMKYVETGPIYDDSEKTERKLNGTVSVPKGIYKKVIRRDSENVLFEVKSFFLFTDTCPAKMF